jgi:hypothetical protein
MPGGGRSHLCVAAQAPLVRLGRDQAMRFLPALQRAAQAISDIEVQAETGAVTKRTATKTRATR